MKLILCRHGETSYSRRALCTGQRDIALTDEGRREVRRLAHSLRSFAIAQIFSSDLLRARETALIIAQFSNCPVSFHPELREQCFGEFEGRPTEHYLAQRAESQIVCDDFKACGGESFNDLTRRVMPFLLQVVASFPEQTVATVAHGSVNIAIQYNLLGGRPENYRQAAGDFTVIDIVADYSCNGLQAKV